MSTSRSCLLLGSLLLIAASCWKQLNDFNKQRKAAIGSDNLPKDFAKTSKVAGSLGSVEVPCTYTCTLATFGGN